MNNYAEEMLEAILYVEKCVIKLFNSYEGNLM